MVKMTGLFLFRSPHAQSCTAPCRHTHTHKCDDLVWHTHTFSLSSWLLEERHALDDDDGYNTDEQRWQKGQWEEETESMEEDLIRTPTAHNLQTFSPTGICVCVCERGRGGVPFLFFYLSMNLSIYRNIITGTESTEATLSTKYAAFVNHNDRLPPSTM